MSFSIQTTFLPRENILFMHEWLTYHASIGCTAFYLYNNQGSTQGYDGRHGFNRNGVNVWDATQFLTDRQVELLLSELMDNFPIKLIPWHRPTYSQCEAAEDGMRLGLEDGQKWMAFIDMDEFIIGDLPSLKDQRACLMLQRKFGCRWSRKGPVTRQNKRMPVQMSETWAPKLFINLGRVSRSFKWANIHISPVGPPERAPIEIAHFNVNQGMLDWWRENYKNHDPTYAGGFTPQTSLTIEDNVLQPFAQAYAAGKL